MVVVLLLLPMLGGAAAADDDRPISYFARARSCERQTIQRSRACASVMLL